MWSAITCDGSNSQTANGPSTFRLELVFWIAGDIGRSGLRHMAFQRTRQRTGVHAALCRKKKRRRRTSPAPISSIPPSNNPARRAEAFLPGDQRFPVRVLLDDDTRGRAIQLVLYSEDRRPCWSWNRGPCHRTQIGRVPINGEGAVAQTGVVIGSRAEILWNFLISARGHTLQKVSSVVPRTRR